MENTININDKIIITGTGRAGTSLLIQLFTHLGMKTGFDPKTCDSVINNRLGHAGLERSPRDLAKDNLHILKQPYFCGSIIPYSKKYNIGHIILPIRQLKASAKSRERVYKTGSGAGSFWNAKSYDEQVVHNAKLIYRFIYNMSQIDIPYTLLPFPQFAKDYNILYKKLRWLFDDYNISEQTYRETMDKVVDLKKIHKFN